LLEKYNVSIVSPYSLPAWSLSEEVIRPTFVDPTSVAKNDFGPLIDTIVVCSENQSNAVWELFAYGPLTAMIRQWPGAPALRVAASVDGLTTMDVDVPKIAEGLRHEKGIAVLQRCESRDLDVFRSDVESALGEVEVIASTEASSDEYVTA
jgi:hypothetical protein